MSKKNVKETDTVTKQTLIGAVVVSLLIGFIGGAVYSSFKLGGTGAAPVSQRGMGSPAPQEEDASTELAARILQMEQYLKENPKDDQAWAQLGNMLFDSDQYEKSIEAYQTSLEINSDQIGVITDMGVMYRRNKQPEKAIEAFDRAIAMDPKFETARFNKGIVLLHDMKDVEGGIKAWEELVEINPVAMAPNGESVDAIIQRMKSRQNQ